MKGEGLRGGAYIFKSWNTAILSLRRHSNGFISYLDTQLSEEIRIFQFIVKDNLYMLSIRTYRLL